MKKFLLILLSYAGVPLVSSLLFFGLMLIGTPQILGLLIVPAIAALFYFLLRKKLNLRFLAGAHAVYLAILALVLTLLMLIAEGSAGSETVTVPFFLITIPFAPLWLFYTLMAQQATLYGIIFLTYFAGFMVTAAFSGKASRKWVFIAGVTAVLLLLFGVNTALYVRRPEVRYAGHGFEYMHGYSSTDFSDYMVYSEPSKLVTPESPVDLQIGNPDEMPILDGAEACYPVYAAMAKAVYKDIGRIEKEFADADSGEYRRMNGKIVSFTNTVEGFWRLITTENEQALKRVDLLFSARPSKDQLAAAKEAGVELSVTPIGREAFVFFVEEDNPVEGLTSDEIRAIYHGDITNWKELGGKNQKITAFQRPKNSGSQTMMEYFMGDVPLKEPMTYETVGSMEGVIKNVAQYANEAGAMGYTFRYFLEGLNQEKGVKMLSVDGVYPTPENIENGSYPLTTALCVISRANDEAPNPNVQKMIDFALSPAGQEIIRKTGYAGVE